MVEHHFLKFARGQIIYLNTQSLSTIQVLKQKTTTTSKVNNAIISFY